MSILIVRVSSLGDVIHNMPMVADILRHYPDAKIDWVVEEAYVDLVRMNDGVRTIIPFALRRWRKSLHRAATRAEMRRFHQDLRRDDYDVIFDTQGLLKTSLVMRMARIKSGGKRVGLANATEGSGYEPISRLFHTQSVPVGVHTHAVQRARMVAAAAFGYAIDTPADFNLQLPANLQQASRDWLPAEPYAVFFHATARAAKQWPQDNWRAIANTLAARDMPILLPWGSVAEKQTAQQLAAHMPNASVLPKLGMMDAVLLAQRATLAIGVDTGLTHIAAAFCRPTIELYCDSPRWKTEGNWSPTIINLGDTGQPPSVAEVRQAITTLLGSVEHVPNQTNRA
ncbi:MAG: lipopolysaccharide heptosyltransferase I [Proteobacteria bacterium]|nr:lipopolysaccharide heptosyltransferase I [Pseudomonadota bacterium]